MILLQHNDFTTTQHLLPHAQRIFYQVIILLLLKDTNLPPNTGNVPCNIIKLQRYLIIQPCETIFLARGMKLSLCKKAFLPQHTTDLPKDRK